VELLRDGVLDSELAATIWVLLEGRVPLIVGAAGRHAGKTTLLKALLDFLPPELTTRELAGIDEQFEWLPQASELGWSGTPRAPFDGELVRPDRTILIAGELSDHTPAYTWDDAARVFIRAASVGYGLAATIHADSLEDVFETLRSPQVRLTDDELSRIGVVLILRRMRDDRRRVVAAHYVRPVARDHHGHIQRLGPAVLTTWNPATDTFEQFGWGITPELALRVGRRAGDFELEVATRMAVLDGLVQAGTIDLGAVRAAFALHRTTAPSKAPSTPASSATSQATPAAN
jgi:hypothetical protein